VAIAIISLTFEEIALIEARLSGCCEDETNHMPKEEVSKSNDNKSKRFLRKKEGLKSVVLI